MGRKVFLLLVTAIWLAGFRSHTVGLRLNRTVFHEGDDIIVTCIVDRFDNNRSLEMGIEDGQIPPVVLDHSTIQLDGKDSDKLFSRTYHARCDAQKAFCIVSDSVAPVDRATGNLEVSCSH